MQNLKSPEELEAEDREAQSAVRSNNYQMYTEHQIVTNLSRQKLQELIRRGTPRDLQAAQELMKTLSGAVSILTN